MARARIALLSNPRSTGNVAQLPRVRAYCAEQEHIFKRYLMDCRQAYGDIGCLDYPSGYVDLDH